jgi:hypothetical protein
MCPLKTAVLLVDSSLWQLSRLNAHKETRKPMNSKRRAFLTSAASGGLGLALTSRLEARPDPPATACQAKLSPADALESHAKFISGLRADLVFRIFRQTNEAFRECNVLLKKLTALVKDLEREILRSGRAELTNPVRQMRYLAEAGVRHGHAIKASTLGSVGHSLYGLQLGYIVDTVGQDAKGLLPEGKNVLSRNATRILNEIVDLTKSSEPLRENLDKEQANANKRADEIQDKLRSAEDLMGSAGSLVDSMGTQTGTQVAGVRSNASDSVTKAIENINWVKTNTIRKELTLEGEELIDAFVTLLEGIVYWINNPEKVVVRGSASAQIEKRSALIKVSFASEASASTGAPDDAWESVLSRLCKRESLQQNAIIITGLIAALTAWRLGREAAALLPTVPRLTLDEKLRKIEKVLRYWGSKVQTACGQPADIAQLAKALEPFI